MKQYINASDIANIKISAFQNIKSNTKFNDITVHDLFNVFQDTIKDAVIKLRSFEYKGEQYKQFKSAFPAVTISATVNQFRRLDDVSSYSGLMAIDIDMQDNVELFKEQTLEEVKQELFKLDFVYAASLSVGGRGIFLIIPIKEPKYLKQYVESAEEIFKEIGVNIDTSCNDFTRLRIMSYDDNLLVKSGEVELYDRILTKQIEQLMTNQPILFKQQRYAQSSKNALSDNDEFCVNAVKLCIKHGLCNDCHRDKSQGAYNKWFAHACRLAALGNTGFELFREISYQNDRRYSDTELINKFNEGSKRYNSRDALAYYFGLLKNKFGNNWIKNTRENIL